MKASAHPRIGRLHVLTDEVLQQRFTHAELAHLAADGGADVVQYRDKRDIPSRERLLLVRQLRRSLPVGVQLVVDDHVDVALAAGADGVHLGRHDMEPVEARRRLGSRVLIGGTANSFDEACQCFTLPLDYIGAGPVFGTRSKSNAPPALGLETLARIVRASPVPVIAIGGITPDNLDAVVEAGVHGVAVLSGIVAAADPAAATARYQAALEAALQRKHVRT